MIVAKLLHVTVQPVFVLVDTDTHDVQPGPTVTPNNIAATALDQLPDLIEQARQQIEQGIVEHDA